MQCPISKDLWSLFTGATGGQGPFVQIKQTLDKWWKSDCVDKLKSLFRAVPIFIIWQIWKRRNIISHGGRMSKNAMIMEINRNLYLLASYKYPCKVVTWECPSEGKSKCNSDGTFKHMLGVGSNAFCIQNHYGDFIFVDTRKVELSSALEVKVRALGVEVRGIKSMLETYNVEIQHIFREGNKLEEFLANNVVNFAGTNRIFNSLQELR
ncbi:hypothetical protein R3W88_026930 [Solanum pinnatisectum]|uniref:RNase H type-1 domain-containing protein n=1 Tax=Solanum pinnatisectum TaxID=50273 RepID=A0AAV9LEK3_9SOLN|nr:hypothetical protein R3W88_026930 [Solanum pinnatisectum]